MAAAAAATPAAAGTGVGGAAPSRFAAACGALSQYVKAAEAGRMSTTRHARPAAAVLPLMPGADVSGDGLDLDHHAAPAPAQTTTMTIVYGGRVLVLDDVPADKAAGLLRLAAGAAAAQGQGGAGTEAAGAGATRGGQVPAADLLPVARKASLQRFMEKRKVRVAARAEPYRRPGACPDHLKLAL